MLFLIALTWGFGISYVPVRLQEEYDTDGEWLELGGVVALENGLGGIAHVDAVAFEEVEAAEKVGGDAAVVEAFGVFLGMVPVGVGVPCLERGMGVEVQDASEGYGKCGGGDFLCVEQRDAETEHLDA